MAINKTKYEDVILEQREYNSTHQEETKEEKPIAVIAALAADIIIGVVKFIAAAITGSSAMVSEGIHSLVDSSDALLVLYGVKASKKAPDIEHPFGHGKQLYFFTFVVSLCIFSMGGGASILKGVQSFLDADKVIVGDFMLNYVVCIIAMLVEGTALFITVKTINKERGEMSLLSYVHNSKDPSNFVVLFEDFTAELGLVFAIVGMFLSQITGNARFDAASSIAIGLLLIAVAATLLVETKGLLIGEGLTETEIKSIKKIVEGNKNVNVCGRILSLFMGPEDLILAIDVNFESNLSERQIMKTVDELESEISKYYPEANRIFIESESLNQIKNQKKKFKQITGKTF